MVKPSHERIRISKGIWKKKRKVDKQIIKNIEEVEVERSGERIGKSDIFVRFLQSISEGKLT